MRTAERLDRARFRLTLFTLQADGPMKARYEAAGIAVRHVSPGGSLVGRGALAAQRRLARLFREERVDVVHCHDIYTNYFCGLAGRAAGLPVITSKRWSYTTRRHGVLNAVAYALSDAILANSETVADSLRAAPWVRADRVAVVPNFVDDAAFEPMPAERAAALRARFGVPGDAEVVGVVARLRPEKNHAMLLEAVGRLAPRHPRLHAVLVGDGEETERLRALAVQLGVAERVHFAGHVPQSERPHSAFDVSALCSWHEGFPNSLVEAMAARRPIVATDVGGVRDAVTDGQTGILVPAGDVDRLTTALARLLSDRAWAAEMGERGRADASVRFRADVTLERLAGLYARVTASHRHA